MLAAGEAAQQHPTHPHLAKHACAGPTSAVPVQGTDLARRHPMMTATVSRGPNETDTWRPRVGAVCSYAHLDERSVLAVAPATIVRVRPDWVLDVDVDVGARTERHYAVRMARSELRPNTWRRRDALDA